METGRETPSGAGEREQLRSTRWESPWRCWELQMYFGPFQQPYGRGSFFRDVLQRHREAVEIIHGSARRCLSNYPDMMRLNLLCVTVVPMGTRGIGPR